MVVAVMVKVGVVVVETIVRIKQDCALKFVRHATTQAQARFQSGEMRTTP